MKVKELLKDVENVELTPEQEKQIKDYLGIKDNKRWKPEEYENYCYVGSDLTVYDTCYRKNWSSDVERIAYSNYFKTKEEAEFAAEKIKVYQELKNFADENNDPIDWSGSKPKEHIYFDHHDNKLRINDCWKCQDLGQIYFSSKELAQQAIKKVGEDRIKKYLFGVE